VAEAGAMGPTTSTFSDTCSPWNLDEKPAEMKLASTWKDRIEFASTCNEGHSPEAKNDDEFVEEPDEEIDTTATAVECWEAAIANDADMITKNLGGRAIVPSFCAGVCWQGQVLASIGSGVGRVSECIHCTLSHMDSLEILCVGRSARRLCIEPIHYWRNVYKINALRRQWRRQLV